MCGIAGIHFPKEELNSKSLMRELNETISHRGPDAVGEFHGDRIAIGQRRLSVIDLNERANQPMYSHCGRYVMVFNGEVYNFMELRQELPQKQWRTNSDSEVIIELFARQGPTCLKLLNGMFALAIWDIENETLFIARDRLGIKPLYYYRNTDGTFCFASEIRPLIKSGLFRPKIDEDSLIDYLRFQCVHAPKTILQDVMMLEAGHYLTSRAGSFDIKKYWDVRTDYSKDSNTQSFDEVKKGVRQKLFSAVEKRLVSDVPFGAFLSGGIDSSAIVGLMSEVLEGPVKTFSVSFDEEEFSERVFADMVARKFKTEHTDIRLKLDDFLHTVPEALRAMDHPSGDGPNTYVVSKVTKQAGITVALSGLGGDELFAGYDVFKRLHRLEGNKWLSRMPRMVRRMGAEGYKAIRPGQGADKMKDVLTLEEPSLESAYPIGRRVLNDHQIARLLGKTPDSENAVSNIIQGIGELDIPILSKVTYAEINTYMQNVLLRDTDQMSMAHALEVRVPFLDHELLEYVFGIRDSFKYPHSPKKLLVESLGTLLPPEIVNRPKMGFVLPWENWLKSDLRSFAEEQLDHLKSSGYFIAEELDDLWQGFLRGDRMLSWSRLWPLIVLGHWMAEHEVK